MAITRLKRKEKKNKFVAKNKLERVKQLTKQPVIKNVDIDAIRAEFEAKTQATA